MKNTPDDVLKIRSLTEKLESGEDVTLEEARYIANTVKDKFSALNPDFDAFDPKLHEAVADWFTAVRKRLPAGGNFVRSIWFDWAKNERDYLDRLVSLDISLEIRKCREKLSFLDGVYEIEYFDPERTGYEIQTVKFEWAGDIRDTGFFKEIKKMKKVLKGIGLPILNFLFPGPDNKHFERCSLAYVDAKDLIYYSAVLSINCPFVHALSCSRGDLSFMYVSDIERNPHIPYIATRKPKDLIGWMLKNGYVNEKTAEKLLQTGSESWISCQEIDIMEVCYEFARYCREYLEVREILEDGSWTDVIR